MIFKNRASTQEHRFYTIQWEALKIKKKETVFQMNIGRFYKGRAWLWRT